MEQGFARRSDGGDVCLLNSLTFCCGIFFTVRKTLNGTVRLCMAHGCVSSTHLVTCEKAGPS